jgi:hypothetical protein
VIRSSFAIVPRPTDQPPRQTGLIRVRDRQYVEQNALRAGLVRRAEDGRWGSFTPALVYRRAVGEGSASEPLGDAVPIPGATRASTESAPVPDRLRSLLVA